MLRSKTNFTLLALSAAGAILSGVTAHAESLSGKGDSFLSQQAAHAFQGGWSRVIARLEGELTPAQQRQLKALGVDTYRHLPIIHSVALSLPSRSLPKLAALPFVTHLSADVSVKKCDEFTVGHSGADTAFAASGLNGYGVTVAVIDSGVYSDPDLKDQIVTGNNANAPSRILANVNYVPYVKSIDNTTNDLCGHGTHVGGIIAGNGWDSTGSTYKRTFYGVARRCSLVNVRVLDANGSGTVSQVISGIQWVINNKTTYKIRVMNLSLGHPVGESYMTDPLCQAVESAWKAGITVVCAAGNMGRLNTSNTAGLDNEGWGTSYGSIQSPGNDPYVITVGAMKNSDGIRADDKIATYSSRGPSRLDLVLKPDIVAPGNQVISVTSNKGYLYTAFGTTNAVLLSSYTTNTTGISTSYYRLSGTSMAAPVVSGAVALMLQKDPTLTPDTIKARLMLSADKWADAFGAGNPCTYGAGYLNIPAALAAKAVPNQAAMSPSMSLDANGNVFINMDRAVWGTDVNGLRAVWGVSSINDLRAVWGNQAIWGSSTNILNASRAVWGTSVWSDRAIWGCGSSAVDLTSTAVQGE